MLPCSLLNTYENHFTLMFTLHSQFSLFTFYFWQKATDRNLLHRIFPPQAVLKDLTSTRAEQSAAYLLALLAGMMAGMSFIFLALCPDVHWVVWQSMIVPMGWIVAPINYLLTHGISVPTSFAATDIVKVS